MKKRILIIEDNPKNMQLEKDLLEMAGFEILEGTSGVEGISLAEKERPDGIVMDLRLPDMRGDLVAKHLRKEKETCDIPIVFVTASVIGDLIVGSASIPKTKILNKPINTRTFAQEISRFIEEGL
jgi:two-component system, cell cycle response regulator DivK